MGNGSPRRQERLTGTWQVLLTQWLPAFLRVARGFEEAFGQVAHELADLAISVVPRGQRNLCCGERLVTAAEASPTAEVAGDMTGIPVAIGGPQAEVKPAVDHGKAHGPIDLLGS